MTLAAICTTTLPESLKGMMFIAHSNDERLEPVRMERTWGECFTGCLSENANTRHMARVS